MTTIEEETLRTLAIRLQGLFKTRLGNAEIALSANGITDGTLTCNGVESRLKRLNSKLAGVREMLKLPKKNGANCY